MKDRFSIDDTRYDLAIIGGGITGAAAARDAAMRGLSVVLFEKADFASGASSKTSKLAHGGLRYLEYGELGLVRESLRERNLLMKQCPHWVRPLRFVFPVYTSSKRPLWQVSLGIRLYRLLAKEPPVFAHTTLKTEQLLDHVPGLHADGLTGGAAYADAQMHDSRLVIENLLDAEHYGAHVFNYVPVKHIDTRRREDVRLDIEVDGARHSVSASCVLNATGAWSNQTLAASEIQAPMVAPTQGAHIVLPDIGLQSALILESPGDRRIFFIVPWESRILVGTTDTFFDTDPDNISVHEEDVSYLLRAFNAYFPERQFDTGDIVASFAGLRPLLSAPAGRSASKVSRRHRIRVDRHRLVSIAGGKYTTYRAMAEESVDRVVEVLGSPKHVQPCQTLTEPFMTPQSGTADISDALKLRYGPRAVHIHALIDRHKALAEPIYPEQPYLKAELHYAIQNEKVRELSDWLERRTHIGLSRRLPTEFHAAAQDVMDEVLQGKT